MHEKSKEQATILADKPYQIVVMQKVDGSYYAYHPTLPNVWATGVTEGEVKAKLRTSRIRYFYEKVTHGITEPLVCTHEVDGEIHVYIAPEQTTKTLRLFIGDNLVYVKYV